MSVAERIQKQQFSVTLSDGSIRLFPAAKSLKEALTQLVRLNHPEMFRKTPKRKRG